MVVVNAATPSGLSDESVMMVEHRRVPRAINKFMVRCIGRSGACGAHIEMMTDDAL